MKQSRKQQAIEARRASDPVAQKVGRTDIDYSDPDQLPTAPRSVGQVTEVPNDPTFKDSEYLAFIRPQRQGLTPLKPGAYPARFEVWSEGWSATGGSSPARLVGKVEALTFREACYIAMCREYLDSIAERRKDNRYYAPDRFDYDFKNLTIWGCRLFDSQAEASKSSG